MNRKARRCCGIDVHKASLSACIRLHGRGRKVSEEIRTFGTTSDELLALHDWLKEHEVTEVAMEATGVYWKPVYYVLEDGFRVILVNPDETAPYISELRPSNAAEWPADAIAYI